VQNLTFEKSGQIVDPSVDGFLSVRLGDTYDVICPEGYRVGDGQQPPRAQAPRAGKVRCI